MAVTQGIKRAYNITAAATSAGEGTAPDRRRLYDFSDRVVELTPEESPFYVYLSKVRKFPTTDPVFRFLENRTKIDWTSRTFRLAADVNAGAAVTAGTSYTFSIDDGTSASIDWLVKGDVFFVNTVYDTTGYTGVPVRVASDPVDAGATTGFSGTIIDLPGTLGGTDYYKLVDDDLCQVIGSSYKEGTGAPDAWSSEIEDDFGNCQIFKTTCELSETAMSTEFRGYADEWARIWALKLREHKIDIEKAFLFGLRQTRSSIRFTEGIVGHILKNVTTPTGGTTDFTYSSGTPYYRTLGQTEVIFDRLLSDFEVLYDPARGGSGDRLVLASNPNVSFFNKLGNGTFLFESMQAATAGTDLTIPWQWNMEHADGRWGHKLLTIDTVHGTCHLVKEMCFRGPMASLMCFADISVLAYRYLAGNNRSRDTFIKTNVQSNDEDSRKDLITSEIGLEVGLPENHMLWNIEGYTLTA